MPDTRINFTDEAEKKLFLANVTQIGHILEGQGLTMRATNYPDRINRSEVMKQIVQDFLDDHLREESHEAPY